VKVSDFTSVKTAPKYEADILFFHSLTFAPDKRSLAGSRKRLIWLFLPINFPHEAELRAGWQAPVMRK
jgi:hypothetical protein